MKQTVPMPFFSAIHRRANRRAAGILRLLFVILFFFFHSQAVAVPPQKLLLAPPSAAFQNGWLIVSLSLTVDNEDGLRDLLKDGAVLELGISAAVEEERSWWANNTLAARDFSSFIRHDPLSREFQVALPQDDAPQEFRDRNLTRLIFATWRELKLKIASLEQLRLESGDADEAVIVLTISLKHAEVPPWLEKSGVFWSSDVVPQEKRTLRIPLPKSP